MTTDDGPDALDRVRRAKARRTPERWLDGGAVAAGVVAALGPQVAPSVLFAAGVPDRVVGAAAAVTVACALFGGYAAAWLAGPGAGRGARHGAAALVAAVVGAAGAAALLLGSSVFGAAALAVPGAGVTFAVGDLLAPSVAFAGLAGAAAGSVGGRRRTDG